MSKLQRFVVCSECSWKAKTNMNNGRDTMFHYHDSMCPSCGNQSYIWDMGNFIVEVYRWVPDNSTWWKPWTWNRGEWVPLADIQESE